ncbi:conserved protein of unknown function [Candidatus Methylacidiphilum fumarolicum]|uniref:Uncharacterized protein n=1 Tax=Candidatus Methylacidiphilum fumarolicum TaxID=591154 RepID=A0ABM9IA72_9BACT|nr:conserved protein of unknown function [Candidatus Methylacidiphilum fumarolicum]
MVIPHKNRLLRCDAERVFTIYEAKNIEVVILNQGKEMTFKGN